jgi:hypothetical protein
MDDIDSLIERIKLRQDLISEEFYSLKGRMDGLYQVMVDQCEDIQRLSRHRERFFPLHFG